MKHLHSGIIGLGVGEQHIIGYESHPYSTIKKLCDFSESKRQEIKKKYPQYEISDNENDILQDPDIDVVSIASYDNYHYSQIMKALQNGKHVFVEKPLCLLEDEAKKIRTHLEKHPDQKLSSNLIMRKYPRFITLRNIIKKGELGELYYMEGDYNYGRVNKIVDGWRGKLDFYSVIYGGAVHIVDLLMWMIGKSIAEVFTYGNKFMTKNTKFKFNDLTVSLLRFEDDSLAKISSNFGCVFPHFHAFTLYGSKATFMNDFEFGKIYNSRDQKDAFRKIEVRYKSINKGEIVYDFVDSIVNNSTPLVSTNDVFKTMSVCFAMEKSMNTNKPEKVDYI